MSIDIEVTDATERVVLDAVGLEIVSATVDGATAGVAVDDETIALVPEIALAAGAHRIDVVFRGRMSETLRGFYASDDLAVTQLQPAYARTLFPCFDRPSAKTTFALTVVAANDHQAISNTPIAREEAEGDRRRVTFATTPPLPPFLLALAIGRFESRGIEVDGVPVRFFAPHLDGREGLVLETAAHCLRFYSEFLGVPYPWTKLDLVAVPEHEAAGMETTGALFFRRSALDADDERVRSLVAHELAHQWFGSLVTPATWNELWLSEGFATWIAAKAVHDPDDVRAVRAAMSADSLHSSRALGAGASATPDVRELFDSIPYRKGAALLRMLEEWLGEEAFRRGVHRYLLQHANGCATADDLWRAVGGEAAAIAAPLVSAPGVPHLTFDWNGDAVRIEQRGGEPGAIPVFMKIALAGGRIETRRELLRARRLDVRMPERVLWVFGNAGAAGYYRAWHAHPSAIDVERLSPAEKSALLDDAWDAVWSGTSDTLAYLRALATVGDDAVVARDHIAELRELLAGGARRAAFDAWLAPRFEEKPAAGEVTDEIEARLADPATRADAWSTLKANWDSLREKVITFGGRGAITALGVGSDPALRADIAAFFAGRNIAGAERALRQTLERIDSRILFRDREQRYFDAWLARQSAPEAAATDQLRFAHSLLNALTAGFHGALAGRTLLDRLGVPAPDWMHPADDLRSALRGLEQLFVQLFHGTAVINPAVLQLAARLREDLGASAALAASALESGDLHVVAAFLVRLATVRDQFLAGLIAFADLLGSEEEATRWRAQAPAAREELARARQFAMSVRAGESVSVADGLLLPGLLRSQAVDLAAIDAWLRGDRTFDHAAASWNAFGFAPEEADEMRRTGLTQPAAAAVWRAQQRGR